MKLPRLFKIWIMVASRVAQTQILNSIGGVFFLIGKVARFLLYYVFIYSLFSKVNSLSGYSGEQVMMFFLVFNLIDIITQAVFRGVYHFRGLVVNGNFDMELLKPLPSYFRPIFGWTDIMDIFISIPLSIFFIIYSSNSGIVDGGNAFIFILMMFNSILLAFSFHLMVCAMCIITTEVDNLIMIYRDLTNMGRFSTDIYPTIIRTIVTFVVPVTILFTIPSKAILGLLTINNLIISFVVTIVYFILSIKLWRYGLKRYSSASS